MPIRRGRLSTGRGHFVTSMSSAASTSLASGFRRDDNGDIVIRKWTWERHSRHDVKGGEFDVGAFQQELQRRIAPDIRHRGKSQNTQTGPHRPAGRAIETLV